MNRPGFWRAVIKPLGLRSYPFPDDCDSSRLVFDRRDVVDGAVEAFGVVPVDPLSGGMFNLFPGDERSYPVKSWDGRSPRF